MRKIQTVCIIQNNKQILLGKKKRGLGVGRWNGFGGHVESGESVRQAAEREVKEEAGLEVRDLKEAGVIEFEFSGKPEILEVHFFSASDFTGEPIETDEMRPAWFDLDKIPYDQMWPDDRYWLPLMLAGKNFKGKFYFADLDTLADFKLEEIL